MKEATVQVSKPSKTAKWSTQDDDKSKKLSFFKWVRSGYLFKEKKNVVTAVQPSTVWATHILKTKR